MIGRTVSVGVALLVLCSHLAGRSVFAQVDRPHVAEAAMDHDPINFPEWKDVSDSLRTAFERDLPFLFDSAYVKYFDSVGPVAMLDYLESKFSRCHGQAHALGGLIYERLGSLSEALNVCADRCTNACTHGVVRAAFGGMSFDDLVARANEICSIQEMQEDSRRGTCAHALGHAFMVATEDSIGQSLEGCASFPSRFDHFRCATGVFMEYRDMMGAWTRAGALPEGDSPEYPCNLYPRYAAACYRYLLPRLMPPGRFDLDGVKRKCMSFEGQSRRGCFHGLGFMFAGKVVEDPSQIADLCHGGDEDDQTLCIEAIVENLAYSGLEQAQQACGFVPPTQKAICTAAADSGYYRPNKPTLPLYLPDDMVPRLFKNQGPAAAGQQ